MIEFQISAPGRIFLCGEHTEMYGGKVVATSLGLRTRLKFNELENHESRIIKIDFPNVGISLSVPLQVIEEFCSVGNFYVVASDYVLLLRHVQYFITVHCWWTTYPQRFSLQTFFFLLFFIIQKEELVLKPFHVLLSTEIAMSTGLGSSTAFATCLAACFLHWSRLQKGTHNGFTQEDLRTISQYVVYSENVIQNFVFSMDHNVCTYGRVTAYQFQGMLNLRSEFINTSEMDIMLVDTNVNLNKTQEMEKLAKMKNGNNIINHILLNEMSMLSEQVARTLREMSTTDRSSDSLHKLYLKLKASLVPCLCELLHYII